MSESLSQIDRLKRPGRKVRGVSAVLLPYTEHGHGRIDERGFRRQLQRTFDAGLGAAVNMDTGYGDLLGPDEKRLVLNWARDLARAENRFFAGALPPEGKEPGGLRYARECETIRRAGGVPVIFPSAFTASLGDSALCDFFSEIARSAGEFVAFELGAIFNPHGRIFSDRVLRALMELPQCKGLKHSSLDRLTEIARLRMRDELRSDFAIYSGNDLAMDMIEYGSDYLLGLSTLAPEAFAARDEAWRQQSAGYAELRDALQYLGWLAFRDPVPAYKHSAAIFLNLTGWLESNATHPAAPQRDSWDQDALEDAARRIEKLCPAIRRKVAPESERTSNKRGGQRLPQSI